MTPVFSLIPLLLVVAAYIFVIYVLWTVAESMKRVAESLNEIAQAVKEKH